MTDKFTKEQLARSIQLKHIEPMTEMIIAVVKTHIAAALKPLQARIAELEARYESRKDTPR